MNLIVNDNRLCVWFWLMCVRFEVMTRNPQLKSADSIEFLIGAINENKCAHQFPIRLLHVNQTTDLCRLKRCPEWRSTSSPIQNRLTFFHFQIQIFVMPFVMCTDFILRFIYRELFANNQILTFLPYIFVEYFSNDSYQWETPRMLHIFARCCCCVCSSFW